MYITSLTVSDFRNFESEKLDFEQGVNVLYGDNGAGKTNLLEALFVLCLGRSQRGVTDPILVRHGCEVYRVEGSVVTETELRRVVVAYQRRQRKKISIDKVTTRIGELYENFCVVSIGPEDSSILSGPPSSRRTFIDIYLSQVSRKYLDNLVRYQRVLSQKNAALKEGMDVSAYNELLVTEGSEIIRKRNEFIGELAEMATENYKRIAQRGNFGFHYQPSTGREELTGTVEEIKDHFRRVLEVNAERERVMQTSLVGPHRDEIEFKIDGLPARHHGSQGEWRTAAISLKQAVYLALKKIREIEPVVLLDEISAELDPTRTTGLIESFGQFGQIFLSTAQRNQELIDSSSRCFRVSDGRVEEVH